MAGWRIGWVCGDERLVAAYADVRNHTNYGQFLPIQKAAAKALANPSIAKASAQRYSAIMDAIVPILKGRGFSVEKPKAGFYIHTQIPRVATVGGRRREFMLAGEFADWMLGELGIIVVPWDETEPAVRLSMAFGGDEQEIINSFKERMEGVEFDFRRTTTSTFVKRGAVSITQ
jgi:LL-diaminopimelate aminotransferase